jgi:hypothetical protein
LRLDGTHPGTRAIIDCDRYCNNHDHTGRICDFVLVSDGVAVLAAIEMKGGKIGATEVIEQLRAGLALAEELFKGQTVNIFLPLLLHGGSGPSSLETRVFDKTQVQFRGVRRRVVIQRCGANLREIIERLKGAYNI